MGNTVTILCFGAIVGRPGRLCLVQGIAELRSKFSPDLIIANGENAAGGTGLDASTAREIFDAGVDVITLGDHTWQKKDLHQVLNEQSDRLVRPANYPAGAPGRGWTVVKRNGTSIAIFNLIGRVFMNHLVDCPFVKANELLEGPLRETKIRIGDMHSEATSEKIALGRLLDGRVSLLFGTHTHVQTADDTIFPGGMAYISDLGMTGSVDGVIGMDSEVALNRFRTGMPHAYKIAAGDGVICGVAVVIDSDTGKARSIERIRHRPSASQH